MPGASHAECKQSFLSCGAVLSAGTATRDTETGSSSLVPTPRHPLGNDDAAADCHSDPRRGTRVQPRVALSTRLHGGVARLSRRAAQPPPSALTRRTLALIRRIWMSAAVRRADRAAFSVTTICKYVTSPNWY